MPQKIILVRHGETDYNKSRRMQGWLDIPLNDQGIQQALVSSKVLSIIKVDAIYSSDLSRAYETAIHISKSTSVSIAKTQALRERDMGIFSGWQWEQERDSNKDHLWEEFICARDNEDLEWNKHAGESLAMMSLRLSQFMKHLHTNHTDQTVVLVTHGGTINRLLELYNLKLASDGFRMITNASILVMNKKANKYLLEELC